jgi:SAM-dependent methyltransferase
MSFVSALETNQTERYRTRYSSFRHVAQRARFDVRYRCRRLHEVLALLGVKTESTRVLEFGFGGGDLLASFPHSASLTGVEVSESAVVEAKRDSQFEAFRESTFSYIREEHPWDVPEGPYDIAVTSHVLEHVPSDTTVLDILYERLSPGGTLAVFVPIEEPDYIPFHRRNYSLQSIAERVESVGFSILHVEGSLYVNGHVWKLLTIPSRRRWSGLRHVVDAVRMVSLSCHTYEQIRSWDEILYRLGFDARQALVVARKPGPLASERNGGAQAA